MDLGRRFCRAAGRYAVNLRLTLGLEKTHRAAAADLYWQAFGGKLGAVMGPRGRAHTYLMRVMRLDQCIAARDGQTLLGIVGLHDDAGSFAGGTAQDFRAVYGWPRSLWGLPLMSKLGEEGQPSDVLMIDGFSVQPKARGKGIGAALLAAVCQHGAEQGFRAVHLDVIDTNWRAKAFYQKHGFTVQSQRNVGALRLVFGFNAVLRMERNLD
jgi:ribosomal protein S18 acetylase RimI-like enzyme